MEVIVGTTILQLIISSSIYDIEGFFFSLVELKSGWYQETITMPKVCIYNVCM